MSDLIISWDRYALLWFLLSVFSCRSCHLEVPALFFEAMLQVRVISACLWRVSLWPSPPPSWPLSLTAVHKFQVPPPVITWYYWTFKLAKPVNVTQFLITCEIFFHWVHHLWQLKCHCFRALLMQLKAASYSTGVSVGLFHMLGSVPCLYLHGLEPLSSVFMCFF